MINVTEYEKFYRVDANAMPIKLMAIKHYSTRIVHVLGHLPCVVYKYNDADIRKYDYVMGQFGVVMYLGGNNYSKTPFCVDLEKQIVKEGVINASRGQ